MTSHKETSLTSCEKKGKHKHLGSAETLSCEDRDANSQPADYIRSILHDKQNRSSFIARGHGGAEENADGEEN